MLFYPALVRKDADSDYGVEFPDFPGCVSAGRTPEEALAMAERALDLHVAGMRDDGDEVPAPSELGAILASEDATGAFAALVPLRSTKGRAVRFNATMDEFLLERADHIAGELGMTRSALLATAVRAFVDSRTDPMVAAMERAAEEGLQPFDAIRRVMAEEEKRLARERHPPDTSKIGRSA